MSLRRRIPPRLFIVILVIATIRSAACDDSRPLSAQIDSIIAASHVGETATIANDYDFVRRVYLSLIGRTPSVDELKTFVSSTDSDKRNKVIDRLLDSDEFDTYFATVLDVMFMERRAGKLVEQSKWLEFLQNAVKQRWSFDRIVQRILTADGRGEQRGASKFLLARQVEPNALTRDIGRLFFGRDLQCAQCHDHPNITDYLQSEYYGIYAFVSRSYLFEDAADNKKAYIGEKADGETEFKSVFLPEDDASKAPPSLLYELSLEVEPHFDSDELYVVAPTKTKAGIPKFSRRAQLARLITHPANETFAKNTVNRFWAHMMGQGIVAPVDFHHDDNPPTHAALLNLLANDFVQNSFDCRNLLRQIARSATYQRSIEFPSATETEAADVEANIQALTTELEVLANNVPRVPAKLHAELDSRRKQLADLDAELDKIALQLKAQKQQDAGNRKKEKTLQTQVQTRQAQLAALKSAATAAEKAANAFKQDAELAKQLATYQKRVDTSSKQLANAKKNLDEQKKLVDKTGETILDLQATLAGLRSERIGIADMVAEARGAVQAAQSEISWHKARLQNKQQQLAACEVHQTYLSKRQIEKASESQVEELLAAVKASRPKQRSLEESLTEVESAIRGKELKLAELAENAEADQRKLAEQQKAIAALEQAGAQAKVAATSLADPDLASAAAVLQEKQAALEAELTAASEHSSTIELSISAEKQAIAELQAKRDVAAADLVAIEKQVDALALARTQLEMHKAATEGASEQLRQTWERRFAVRALVPLSPEQLAGGTINALELRPSFQRAAESEWEKKHKDKKPEEVDTKEKAALASHLLFKSVWMVC